jgi:hypothetical protein
VSALDRLDAESVDVIRTVLERRGPDTLAILEASDVPSLEVRELVTDLLADEFDEHVSAPAWEPTAWGRRVDDALGWFLHGFPIES